MDEIQWLFNQNDFAIYDSRAAHGLSDLTYNGKRFIPIPPGRCIKGDTDLNKNDFCESYEKYIWVLRFFRELAKKEDRIREEFKRVSDFDIAFFAKSRLEVSGSKSYTCGDNVKPADDLDKGNIHYYQDQAIRQRNFGRMLKKMV